MMLELVFWVYIAMTVASLLIVGIFHDYPSEMVVNAVLWPAMAVMILGCAIRDIFDLVAKKIR